MGRMYWLQGNKGTSMIDNEIKKLEALKLLFDNIGYHFYGSPKLSFHVYTSSNKKWSIEWKPMYQNQLHDDIDSHYIEGHTADEAITLAFIDLIDDKYARLAYIKKYLLREDFAKIVAVVRKSFDAKHGNELDKLKMLEKHLSNIGEIGL